MQTNMYWQEAYQWLPEDEGRNKRKILQRAKGNSSV